MHGPNGKAIARSWHAYGIKRLASGHITKAGDGSYLVPVNAASEAAEPRKSFGTLDAAARHWGAKHGVTCGLGGWVHDADGVALARGWRNYGLELERTGKVIRYSNYYIIP